MLINIGTNYGDTKIFDLATMEPYSLQHLSTALGKFNTDYVLYLPRTSDLRQVAKPATEGEKLKIVHYCMHGASKAVCAYYGSFQFDDPT